jgi:hypothetical protein
MMTNPRASQTRISRLARAGLVLFIVQLIMAGCQSDPTPSPTDIPSPTNTPDPNVDWTEFVDPWGRYSVRFPPDWHLFPAVLDTTGYATTISTINLSDSGEPSREVEVIKDEFYIWFTVSGLETTAEVNLMGWALTRLHPGGSVTERTEETIAGMPAVVELIELHNGQRAKIVHFSTSSGILSIFAQPLGNPESELFDLLLTTISF